MWPKFLIGVLALGAAMSPLRPAMAADTCSEPSADCVAVAHWNFSVSLGAGVRTNPLVGGENIPLVVIPQFSYYGKRFFLDDLDLGFTLAENDANAFNLVASPGYDRVYFYRSDLQNIFVNPLSASAGVGAGGAATTTTTTPPGSGTGTGSVPPTPPAAVRFPARARHITYLAGPEWTFKYAGVTGQLDVLHEITDQNHGNEVRAAISVPLIEAHGTLAANVGITWNSASIVNYYYGASNVYTGGSALDPFIKLGYTLPLHGKWRFNAFAQDEKLADAIANSPIVAEHHVVTAFVGCTYAF
jgi:outer membrane protein